MSSSRSSFSSSLFSHPPIYARRPGERPLSYLPHCCFVFFLSLCFGQVFAFFPIAEAPAFFPHAFFLNRRNLSAGYWCVLYASPSCACSDWLGFFGAGIYSSFIRSVVGMLFTVPQSDLTSPLESWSCSSPAPHHSLTVTLRCGKRLSVGV